VDLGQPCDDGVFAELRAALAEWKVLFFRNQPLTKRQHADFAARWGQVVDDQLVFTAAEDPVDNIVEFTRDAETTGLENGWHSDGTFRPMPTMGTILRAVEVPPIGGDTMFVDMAAVYDNLPAAIKSRIAGLRAMHDWSLDAYASKYGERLDELRAANPPVEHPVVIRHPETGRLTLFVNRLFTSEIVGLDREESDDLLDLLCRYLDLPEFHCRFRWEPGSIAFWDNIAVQHYGVNDYFPARRVMVRATFFSREHTCLTGVAGAGG
jgi:taurine dioxygenase